MSNVITLYDIPSDFHTAKSWSPNCWKTRLSLNYKGLQYKTVWVEYPDIAETLKAAGIPASSTKADGSPFYTCPAIFDPATGTAVSESSRIAEYLDKQYPDAPKLFPAGSHALQHAFIDNFYTKIAPLFQFAIPATHAKLNAASHDYFRKTREALFGTSLETLTPTGEKREVEWAKVKAVFDKVDEWLQTSKSDGPFLVGREPGFADLVLGSVLGWLKGIWGEESKEWKDIKSWSEGRWEKYLERFEPYRAVRD